jgi:hypothetical protein
MERINVKTINRRDIYNIGVLNTEEEEPTGVLQCSILEILVKNGTPYTHWMSDRQYIITVYMMDVVEPSNLVNRISQYSNNSGNKLFYIQSDAAGLNPTIRFDMHDYPLTSFTRVTDKLMSPTQEVMDRSLVAHPRVQQIQDDCLGKYCPRVNRVVNDKLYDRFLTRRHLHTDGGTKKKRKRSTRRRNRRKLKN